MKAQSKSATGRRFRSAIGMLTTTQIETLRRNYECEIVPGLAEFERTAILKGIAAELAQRDAERGSL